MSSTALPLRLRCIRTTTLALLGTAAFLAGCDDGDRGSTGPEGPAGPGGPTPTALEAGEDAPGIRIEILELEGASGPGGNFAVGDTIEVTFSIKKEDGSDWDLTEMSRGRILVSGPSFNYSRLIPEVTDVLEASVLNEDGTYTYTFATAIPDVYAAPVNDTESFGAADGELTGQALLDGTYTVGLYTRWNYTVDGESARDADNATFDFLLGSATTLAPRDVVSQTACNNCHSDLRIHGGMRKDVRLCVLCHTAGSEDRNTDGLTPGATVDFGVMIHRIHNAKHLPSVLGVATNPDGSRNYAATPEPYELVGFGDNVIDFSHVAFPAFPNLALPMPRDEGYSALGSTERGLEDEMRRGVTNCAICHGDPDGDGPEEAPAQGDLAYSQPTRSACGSCHDDVHWDLPYTSNTQTMPAQNDDATCKECHDPSGNSLAVMDAHLHPLLDSLVNTGLNFDVTALGEAAGGDSDGTLDPGEKVEVTLTIQDDAGADFDPADLGTVSIVVAGPTSNSQMILNGSVPDDVLVGGQPYVFNLPEEIVYEFVGDSASGVNNEMFTTSLAPHWNGASSATTVYSRAPVAGGTTLMLATTAFDNFIDVVDSAGFAADDIIVLDDANPGEEEYLRVQRVDDRRLWFASPYQSGYQPGVRMDHAAGTTVHVAVLTELVEGDDYTIDAETGTVTEDPEVGDVALVVTYTTDFVMPSLHGLALNASPDLDDSSGKWTGKSLVDGTYKLTIWSRQDLPVDVFGEVTTYRGTSTGESHEFLVGDASELEPYDLISSASDCASCHQDLYFHGGGRRGLETCLACHGTAGAEDRPTYRAWGAPETEGLQVSFREMIHKIHMGAELANASAYTIVGFGSGGPPNNFSEHHYDEVHFPAMPGGVAECSKCHGESDAWMDPGDRDHPTEQLLPVREWGMVCSSCHDSDAAVAHIETQTSTQGAEACATCHGEGREWAIEKMHHPH